MATTRVLVAGAGIAGLAAANALARLDGFEIDVVDPDPRPVGVAVGLSSCALRGLDSIGVLDAVLAASAPSMELHMCAADGTTLVHTTRRTPHGQRYPDNVIVDRLSLAEALGSSLDERGVGVRSGVALTGVEHVDGGAIAFFDGAGPARYDLVVGADGIGSRLRGAVIDESPRALGQLGLRWVTYGMDGLDHGVMYLGGGAVKLGLWPLRDGRVYAFLTLPRPGMPRAARQEVLAELRTALDGYSFPGAETLRADVPWDEVHIAAFQSLFVDGPWHDGRVVLVGDAVHAMPPHGSSGAAMAIEDAHVLADELGRRPIAEALTAYGRRRRDRVRRVVAYSTENCLAENRAAVEGAAPTMDPDAAQEFWEFLRTEP
jgi:2-polyprenyl-6-methoxyphenol hydroxylase-like FAD-dependent oxidoreductase